MVECRPALDAVERLGVRSLLSSIACPGSSARKGGVRIMLVVGRGHRARSAGFPEVTRAPASRVMAFQHRDTELFPRAGGRRGQVRLAPVGKSMDDAIEVVVKTAPAFMKNTEAARPHGVRLCCEDGASVFHRDHFSQGLKTHCAVAKCLTPMAILPRSIETVMPSNKPEIR